MEKKRLGSSSPSLTACGVILGKLIAKKEGEELPVAAYITILITTALMMLTGILSVFIKLPMIDTGELGCF